jgi:hypothetical protein
MNNVQDFIKVRQEIEILTKEIDTLIQGKVMPQSKTRFDEATVLLTKLTTMADNDVQHVAVGRLTRLLFKLGTKVGMLNTKTRTARGKAVS